MLPSFSFLRSHAGYASLLAITMASSLGVAASCAKAGSSDGNFQGPPSGGDGGLDGTLPGDDGGPPSFREGGSFPTIPGEAGSDGGCASGCTDFPSTPVTDPLGPLPAGADPSTLFPGDGTTGTTAGAPCVSEPANGALYPYNWLRPRVYWAAPTTETVFEVRLSSPGEMNDYVVYTTNHYWALDEATWQTIAGVEGGAKGTLVSQQITVTVRGNKAAGGTPAIGNTATFSIAPAIADGSLIFWSTASFAATSTSTDLQGFHVGDEGTTTALTVPQVQQKVWAGPPDGGNFPQPPVLESVGCIGCHTATPDGNYVGFTGQWPWPNALASVQADSGAPVGAAPPWLTPGAVANLGPNTNDANYLGGGYINATNNVDNVMLGIQTFSAAHYATGDRIEVTSVGASMDQPDNSAGVEQPIQPACQGGTSPCVVSQLAWIDLEWNGSADAGNRPSAAPASPSNGGWGILARTGDGATRSAGTPNWSNDGKTIAYTSVIQGTMDGRLYQPTSGSADIKTIPYSANAGVPGGAGGAATSLPGASDPAYNEYFPAFSPDDSLIAFDRVGSTASMYDQPLAEVFVVPYNGGAGGTAVRLLANDPVSCTGLASPGVQNTWPKWAPNPIPPGDAGGVPAPQTIDGNTYYWITFSSTRSLTAGATSTTPGKQQLYVAGIIVDGQGNITTFAPIYLWNQDDTSNNLIPAWGEFAIPPGLKPPPPPPISPPPQ
jgi:WD40-like Beta Propeller Repeat